MTTQEFQQIQATLAEELNRVDSLAALDELRTQTLGRKGRVTSLFEKLKNLPPQEKQEFGKRLNVLKESCLKALAQKQEELEEVQFSAGLSQQNFDATLPATHFFRGKQHPLSRVMAEVCQIFSEMGFAVEEGPQIELDLLNFDALNIARNHPARDMHDTFYIADEALDKTSPPHPKKTAEFWKLPAKYLLRTHTSPVQVRVMLDGKLPIRMIAPGKVFRHEAVDATHSSVFHQVEGLVVAENVSLADLKSTLKLFVKKFFGPQIDVRFRPSYFPFVEPGIEVDMSCSLCLGKSDEKNPCAVCKNSGWLEMLGAGLVHPEVFRACGLDPEKVSGFAFGLGIERIAMIRYGIKDMRLFYENLAAFLRQF